MDIESFRNSPIGTLVPISGWDSRRDEPYDTFAYVPVPLPDRVTLSQDTVWTMGEADRALGSLGARIRFLPNPRLLVRPALKKEAQATSALEGTFAHLEDVLKADFIDPPRQSNELREVLNYERAAVHAIEMITDLPICKRVLEDVQKIIVAGTRGDGYDAGKLRERQVFIGDEGAPVADARFVPPPPGETLIDGFSEWERWVNADDKLPLIAKLAMAHYQFETLHPFSDGNGRLGRLIITLQLLAGDVLEYPLLNLSSWFEPRREGYVDALRQVTITGDFDPWIQMFARAVRDRSKAVLSTIDALLGYRDAVIGRAEDRGVRGITSEVVDVILANPFLSVSQMQKARGVAWATARTLINKLVELDVLQEITGGDYGRIYHCRDVSRLIIDS